jgi:hypothetical protein
MPANQTIARMRALKVIIAVMAGGLFTFTVIVVVLVTGGSMETHVDLAPLMMIVLGGLAACEAIGYVVLRQGIIAKTRGFLRTHSDFGEPSAAIGNAFAMLTIVAGAMLEGLGLFGAVIVLVTGEDLALAAPAVAILLLLAFVLPNEEKARNFATRMTAE